MARIRTINQAIDEIKEVDPQNALTRNALRQLIISKRIPSICIGAGKGPGPGKYLVDLDAIYYFLQNPQPAIQEDGREKIRRISGNHI